MKPKFLLSSIIFLSIAITSKAQISSGKIFLGGSVSYNSSTNPDTHAFYSNIQLGKVVKNNSVLGVLFNYSSNNYNYSLSFKNKTRTTGGGVFYRKYKPLGKNFYAFGEINAAYSHTNNDMAYFNPTSQYLVSKADQGSLYLIPGISYSVCKNMQIELSMPNIAYISYQHMSTIDKYLPPSVSPQKRNTFNANASLNNNLLSNFGIGFKFFLGS
ncbi:MAG: hypothetical protein ABJA90_07370 [Ginsengibacter sp.]